MFRTFPNFYLKCLFFFFFYFLFYTTFFNGKIFFSFFSAWALSFLWCRNRTFLQTGASNVPMNYFFSQNLTRFYIKWSLHDVSSHLYLSPLKKFRLIKTLKRSLESKCDILKHTFNGFSSKFHHTVLILQSLTYL